MFANACNAFDKITQIGIWQYVKNETFFHIIVSIQFF